MIKAMIFDLDGTLVKTEQLKAISYARAAVELRPNGVSESEVVEGFKEFVGLSRQEVGEGLLGRFDLGTAAAERMSEYGVGTPWEAYVRIRLAIYNSMLADPEVLQANRWPHNMALLEAARKAFCKVGLATMSRSEHVKRVLEILDLTKEFDFVATRDDVSRGKPDPEIYMLTAMSLEVEPEECLVVEDSPAGVEAALSAGMDVVAVGTPFTRERLHQSGLLPPEHIVDEPERLPAVISHILSHHV